MIEKNWDKLSDFAESQAGQRLINVNYKPASPKLKLPVALFSNVLAEKRPEYAVYAPYDVEVVALDESPKNLKNPYLKKDKIIGINDGDFLTLHVGSEYKESAKSLLWLLFHEFRHKIQANSSSIRSCFWPEGFNKIVKKVGYTEDSINHVFHDFLPYEVDANIFACEMMDIQYIPGKWPVDFTRLKKEKK